MFEEPLPENDFFLVLKGSKSIEKSDATATLIGSIDVSSIFTGVLIDGAIVFIKDSEFAAMWVHGYSQILLQNAYSLDNTH
jgi:hypothetical protein